MNVEKREEIAVKLLAAAMSNPTYRCSSPGETVNDCLILTDLLLKLLEGAKVKIEKDDKIL